MGVIAGLRKLRHGPLKSLGRYWFPLGRAYRGLNNRLPFVGSVAHRIGPYGPFRLDGQFAFSDFEKWGSGHNRGFQRCIEACRGKRCVFDVGAHIGLVSLPMAAAVAAGGRVYSFEPAAANLKHLRAHLALNHAAEVTVVEALVGAEERAAVRFYERPDADGQNSIIVKKNPEFFSETERAQVTLDGFCRTHALAPEVIKIDVEGGEIGVLEGAREVLSVHRPTIFLSVHPTELSLLGHASDSLARLIEELGYSCRDVEGNPVAQFRLDEYVLEPVV